MLLSSMVSNSTTVRSRTELRLARVALQASYVLSENLGSSLAERLFTSPRRFERPERELAVLADGRRFTVPVTLRSPRWDGRTVEVAAWRWGFGPTVLLVHGWEGRGAQLGALVAPLVAAGMSVVAFDAPAHGDTPGSRLYLTDHADAVADVAAAVGPVHAVVAHSFGAAAVALARTRNGLHLPRHVMIAPNLIVDTAVASFARTVGLDDADRLTLESNLATSSGVSVASLCLERLVGDLPGESLLVIHDHDDREIPFADGARVLEALPEARLVETVGLGHRRILRDATVIEEVVAACTAGVAVPASDLVREVDRLM